MRWTKKDKWYIQSECDKYKICKALVAGIPKYSAYKQGELIGTYEEVTEAKKVCEAK